VSDGFWNAALGTPLDIACVTVASMHLQLSDVATEVGIEPTVRHGADLGYIPIVVEDACGAGHQEAEARAFPSLRYIGDAIFTDVASFREALRRKTETNPVER
jgi:biuret amidohydrolase